MCTTWAWIQQIVQNEAEQQEQIERAVRQELTWVSPLNSLSKSAGS
jgi:hypothetical protein